MQGFHGGEPPAWPSDLQTLIFSAFVVAPSWLCPRVEPFPAWWLLQVRSAQVWEAGDTWGELGFSVGLPFHRLPPSENLRGLWREVVKSKWQLLPWGGDKDVC